MVWSEPDRGGEEVRVERVRAEREHAVRCRYVPTAEGGELCLWVADASGCRLRAEPSSHALVWPVADAMLEASTIEVEVDFEYEAGHPLFGSALVRRLGILRPAAVGTEVDATTLAPALQQQLDAAAADRSGFAFDRDAAPGEARLPRRWQERLRELDLAPLLASPPPRPVVAFGVVFTTADGQPWAPPAAATEGEAAPAASEPHELERLAGVRALVRAGDGERSYTFALAMDRAWLWSEMERASAGRVVLRSRWSAVDGAGASPAARPGAGAEVAGRLRRRELDITWETRAVASQSSWAGKLALTPLALAGDVLVGWLLASIGVPWCDGDDAEDEQERERRRQQQRDRQRARRR